VVGAGRFRALKVVLRGQAQARSPGRGGALSTEYVVWYGREAKRPVKVTVSTHVGNALREATTVELVEFKVQ
jgi:hypothetical protein